MGDPYDVIKAFETLRNKKKIDDISKGLGNVIKSMQNQSPVANYVGGGGTSTAAPVSTLASLPNTPIVQDLISKGILKEGMPAEQSMAIIALANLKGGVAVDIEALMKSVEAMYQNYTGDILTAGADWMQDLYGTTYDPNDPNSALFAQDPLWSSYAGGMAQIDETADLNLATDQAWFLKNQAAQQAYYDGMMQAIAAGTIPIGTSGSGGGFGGGRGGGGSSGDEEEGAFSVPKVKATETESLRSIATDDMEFDFPGWTAALGALGNTSPQAQELITEALAYSHDPEAMAQYIMENMQNNEAAIEEAELYNTSNDAWNAAAPSQLDELLRQYSEYTGRTYDPETGEIVPAGDDFVAPTGPIPENLDYMEQVFNQAYTMTPELAAMEASRAELLNSPNFQRIFGQNEPTVSAIGPENELGIPTYNASMDEVDAARPPYIDPFIQMANPNAGETTQSYNFDEGSYGIDYGQAPDMINRPIAEGPVYSFLANASPEERQQYLIENMDLIEQDPWATQQLEFWRQENPTSDADILIAVQEAQRETDLNDTHSNNDYFSNDYQVLSPEQQAAVDQILNQEGLSTPNSTIEQAAARRLQEILHAQQVEAARPQSIFDQTVGSIPIFGRQAAEGMEQVIANQIEEDEADILHHGNRIRPDLLATMQAQSQNEFAQNVPEGMSPEDYQHLLPPGTYWTPPTMDETEIAEAELENQTYEQMMGINNEFDSIYQMVLQQAGMVDSAMEQNQLSSTSTAESVPYAELMTSMGDPNTAPLEVLDPIPEPQGFFGSSRVLPQTVSKPGPKKMAGKTYSGVKSKPKVQSKKSPIKLSAAKGLASTLSNLKKKQKK